MRKFIVLAVLVGAAVFAAVSLASTDQRKDPAANASATSSLGLRYLFADVNLAKNQTDGHTFKCPQGWHPVSGLFNPDSNEVTTAFNAPTSQRKWRVRVRNDGNSQTKVTIGAVCVKGLPLR
jgi:hypothetical protein